MEKTRTFNKHKKTETYGVESTSRAGGAREAPGVRLRSLALQPTSTQSVAIPWRHQINNTACAHILEPTSTRSGAIIETIVSSAGPS